MTLESWTSIGHNDAKALKQYKEEGNEIIVLDTKFKKAVVEESKKWAAKNAKKTSGLKKCMTIRLNLTNFGLIQSPIVMCTINLYDFKKLKIKNLILFFYFFTKVFYLP